MAVATTAVGLGCGEVSARAPDQELVRVPVAQTDVVDAYFRLRKAGLRVAIREDFSINTLCFPKAIDQRPLPGRRVRRGAVVTLGAGGCDFASPAGHNHPPQAVPNFVGKTVQNAVLWADRLEIEWGAQLPLLPPSSRQNLLDNYLVTHQSLEPGTKVQRLPPNPSDRLTFLALRARSH